MVCTGASPHRGSAATEHISQWQVMARFAFCCVVVCNHPLQCSVLSQLALWSWRAHCVCPRGTWWLFAVSWERATAREHLQISMPPFSKMKSRLVRHAMAGWTSQLSLSLMRVSTDVNTQREIRLTVFWPSLVILFLVSFFNKPGAASLQQGKQKEGIFEMRTCLSVVVATPKIEP